MPAGASATAGSVTRHDDYDTAVTDAALIDPAVLERVLGDRAAQAGVTGRGVRRGPPSTTAAMLDDGRVEELSSGRERGAGIRVVDGETTGFAHTADLSEAGLLRPPHAAAAAVARGGGGGVAHRGPRTAAPTTSAPPEADTASPEAVAKARKLELLPGPTRPPGSAGGAITQVQVGCRRRPAPGPDRQLGGALRPATTRSAPGSRVVRGHRATPACRPGYETAARTVGFELFDAVTRRGAGRAGGRRALVQAVGPARRPRARCRSCWPAGAAASSSTRPAATASRPTTSSRTPRSTPARSASWWPARW